MDWLDNLQKLGGQAYGAAKNKPPSKPKIANLPADYKSTEAAAFKAADAAKGGMKIGDWSADQWLAVGKALTPLMERLQKRRRR